MPTIIYETSGGGSAGIPPAIATIASSSTAAVAANAKFLLATVTSVAGSSTTVNGANELVISGAVGDIFELTGDAGDLSAATATRLAHGFTVISGATALSTIDGLALTSTVVTNTAAAKSAVAYIQLTALQAIVEYRNRTVGITGFASGKTPSAIVWKVSGSIPVAEIAGSGFVNINQQVFGTNVFVDSTNGIFAIPAAGKWRLSYDLSTDGTGANTNSHFAITDNLNNVVVGSERARGGGVTTSQALTAEVIVTTSGAANYKLRGRNGGTGSTTVLNSVVANSTLTWTQIGLTAVSGGSSLVGDAKSGFQSTDHNGWILLNGRAISTLTVTQQAAAISLGFTPNLPNGIGRVLIMGTLGAQLGSATISQANLPNVNLTSSSVSAGTPAGNVSLITHSSDAGGFDPSPTAGIGNLQQTDRTPENTITLGVSIGGGFAGAVLAPHAHTVPLGGLGSSYTPAAIGVNHFIYLGN